MTVRRSKLALVETVRVDQGKSDRQQGRALVVINDNDVEVRVLRLLQRFERLRSTVDGDRQARALDLQLDQGSTRRAVALHQAVGDVDHWFRAEAAEKQHQHR